jgi:hypothetical protein
MAAAGASRSRFGGGIAHGVQVAAVAGDRVSHPRTGRSSALLCVEERIVWADRPEDPIPRLWFFTGTRAELAQCLTD